MADRRTTKSQRIFLLVLMGMALILCACSLFIILVIWPNTVMG